MIVRLHQSFFAVIDEPDLTPALDGLPEQRIRLEHPSLFCLHEPPSSEPE